ncbi:MAG: class I SAM-dependent methyltransferase [Azospirillaceae bacterium]
MTDPPDSTPLAETILRALAAAGLSDDPPSADDLRAVDEFHIRGRAATDALAEAAGISAGDRVLDAGCGLGGPARRLAAVHGALILGTDLSERYVRAASTLTVRVGLGERCRFAVADSTALPVAGGAVDVVWSQHATMAIADKDAVVREWRRALGPGGRLALYEIVAGPGGPPHLPAPWAETAAESFLEPESALVDRLARAGFAITHRRDDTDAATAWFARQATRPAERGTAEKPPPVGLHLVLGPVFTSMAANQARNLAENRTRVIEIVARAVRAPDAG